jgi:KaiC/GvpD/RAD55 family RecA-like ATPase
MEYIRLSENYNKNFLIPITESPYSYAKDLTKPWFTSMFQYSEEQFKKFQETHSLSGITDNYTNKLWADFDFDAPNAKTGSSLKDACHDALLFYTRLEKLGCTEENIQICFSGNKGIAIVVETDQKFDQKQVKNICFSLGEDLPTFDRKMYDSQRIFRLPFSKNEKTGLYKIPLTYQELHDYSLNTKELLNLSKDIKTFDIKETLEYYKKFYTSNKNIQDFYDKHQVPVELKNKHAGSSFDSFMAEEDLDYTNKPKFLTNCRWSLQNGYFKSGERNSVLLCLAATYKNQGFNLEIVYRMLKGVAEVQATRNNTDRFPDNEIYNNVVMQVFSPNWHNGQYSCREPGNFLYDYCKTLGVHKCDHKSEDQMKPQTMADLTSTFKTYTKNIDKNTIHTGIPSIDKHVFLSTGANVGLVGGSGSGKSSIALNILRNTSKAGVKTVFASLDMASNRMYEKVMYNLTGFDRKKLYETFQNNEEGPLVERLKEEYGNVNFFSKSCPTVEDIKNYVLNCQEATGEKIKLVMLDYFERVSSDFSDDTAASKNIAGQLQDLVNDLDIALITIVQPNKNALSGGIDQPIYDYTKIKGSSYLYQSFRIIMSCWRPFYNPKDFANDKYLQMAVLKNDLGELNEFAFKWNGKKGEISEMEQFEEDELYRELRDREEKKKLEKKEWM